MKDDTRETKKAYFNYAFRIDEDAIGMRAARFRMAFSAEIGFEAESCYQPLNDCTLYRPQTKSRHDLSEAYWKMIDPSRFHLPVSNRLYAAEAVCFHHRYLLGSKSDVDQIAAAVKKVIEG
jgi:L-glutamine:2-deoxy-scyllo-inosose/3-amino-2,3-dideoxy-scyllo-inosose aminotransferase